MTDRRERAAEAAYNRGFGTQGRAWHLAQEGPKVRAYAVADAVLDTLKDELLPEAWPEWAFEVLIEGLNSASPFAATINEWEDSNRPMRYVSGTGPTIPAAIRNALEQS